MKIETDNLKTIANYARTKSISVSYVKRLADNNNGVTIVLIDGVMFVDTSRSSYEKKR